MSHPNQIPRSGTRFSLARGASQQASVELGGAAKTQDGDRRWGELPGALQPVSGGDTEGPAHLRIILDGGADHAVTTLDLQGRITGWSQGAEAITGYAVKEAIGRPGDLLLTAEDRAAGVFASQMRRALEGGCVSDERWQVRRDGSRFRAGGAMLPVIDRFGQVSAFVVILHVRSNAAGTT